MASPTRELLSRLVNSLFPGSNFGLIAALAYGSVAFPQRRPSSSRDQLDLIIVVNNPVDWHRENLNLNAHHYNRIMSLLPTYCSTSVISNLPGPQVYYNPLVEWQDDLTGQKHLIKYGVISLDKLLEDLCEWSFLYIAGRLHKPVSWIPLIKDEVILEPPAILREAYRKNCLAALAFSILTQLKPTCITEQQLFFKLAGISYEGDYRMWMGEDKQKVRRLVSGQNLNYFRELYKPLFTSYPLSNFCTFDELQSRDLTRQSCMTDDSKFQVNWRQDSLIKMGSDGNYHPELVYNLIHCLPENFCVKAVSSLGYKSSTAEAKQILATISSERRLLILLKTIRSIVFRSSAQQTLIGLFSSGPYRSVLYVSSKIKKMLASIFVR